jgi:Trypsin-like peptidase domain
VQNAHPKGNLDSMNTLTGIGLLLRAVENDVKFLGTCFAFRQPTHFLTAAHCVAEVAEHELAVALPLGGLYRVQRVVTHPNADIAVVTLVGMPDNRTQPFWNPVDPHGLGDEFFAFGYPEDTFGEDPRVPTPRMFKGHFQRLFPHKSHLGYRYQAGELNIACPSGLSGGPVYRPAAPVMVLGVAAENLKSTTYLETVEDVERDGVRVITKIHSMIEFGVCVMLSPLIDWLNVNVPTEPPYYVAPGHRAL